MSMPIALTSLDLKKSANFDNCFKGLTMNILLQIIPCNAHCHDIFEAP